MQFSCSYEYNQYIQYIIIMLILTYHVFFKFLDSWQLKMIYCTKTGVNYTVTANAIVLLYNCSRQFLTSSKAFFLFFLLIVFWVVEGVGKKGEGMGRRVLNDTAPDLTSGSSPFI
jgi:hypothetical protein